MQSLWLEVAEDPTEQEIDALLETLPIGSLRDVVRRVAIVSSWPDPAVALALAAMVEAPRHRSLEAKEQLWPAVFAELERRADPGTIASLRRALPPKIDGETVRTWMEKEIRRILAVLEAEARRRGVELPEAPPEAAAPEPEPRADEVGAALLARIAADPFDDRAKQVYADYLLERGDPRGEFIVLQLAAARGQASAKQQARARALQRAHWKDWLGVLAPLARKDSVVFEKGFLAEVALGKDYVKDAAWEGVVGDPIFATVRDFTATRLEAAIRAHPAAKSLRARTMSDRAALVALTAASHRWPVKALTLAFEATADDVVRIADSDALISLASLTLRTLPADPAANHALADAVFARLTRLETVAPCGARGAESALGPWLRPLVPVNTTVAATHPDVTIHLVQGPDGADLELQSTYVHGARVAAEILRAIPRGPFGRITVRNRDKVPEARIAALRAECRRLGARHISV